MKLNVKLDSSLDQFCLLLKRAVNDAIEGIHELGFHDSHVSSTFVGFLQSDCDQLCKAVERYMKRPDSNSQMDMYQCLRIISDRVSIESIKLLPIDKLDNCRGLRYLDSILEAVRGQFMQEHKGVDYASRPMDKDGNLYRTNTMLKLERQKVFERHHIGEKD